MTNKVQNSNDSLCKTCRHAIVVKMKGTNQDIVRCQFLERNMTKQVEECSVYDHKNTPMKYEMESIAWILETNKGRIGFVKPKRNGEEVL